MTAASDRVGDLYETTLRPRIEAMEGLRASLRGYLVKVFVLIAGPTILFATSDLYLQDASTGTTALVNAGLFIAIIAGVFIAATRYMLPGFTVYVNYRSRFKREVVADIFAVVSPGTTYTAFEGIPSEIFDAAGIFSTRGATSSDDRVRGLIGRTP